MTKGIGIKRSWGLLARADVEEKVKGLSQKLFKVICIFPMHSVG